MSSPREQEQPRYLGQRDRQEDWPLQHAHEPAVAGRLLLGAVVLCLDFWLLGLLTVRWLT